MDQVSRPFQIALVAVVLLAGMWFTVLRPKSDSGSTAPVAPGTAGLSTAVDKANGASAASDAANAAVESATGDAAAPSADATSAAAPAKAANAPGKAAKPAAAKPAGPATDPSTKLLAKLGHGKTVVLLFRGKGADDHAAGVAVRRATRGDHRVAVASAPIGKVGDYQAITSGVDVLTSPTILVIDKNRQAIALTGYVDQRNVSQAIGDARRASKK
ncbi:MAG TPA: hypothetical protein VFT50_12795 [Baekduia sp.]|nr:hypothetical protein [Baekduia sp.]